MPNNGPPKTAHYTNITIVMYLCLLNAILGISSHGGKYAYFFCSGPYTLKSGSCGPLATSMKSISIIKLLKVASTTGQTNIEIHIYFFI